MDSHLPILDGLSPRLWGRSAWEFMDALMMTYGPEKRAAMAQFLPAFGMLLPCKECREHFQTFLALHSMDEILASRMTLLDFYYRLRISIPNQTNMPFRSRLDMIQSMMTRFKVQPQRSAITTPRSIALQRRIATVAPRRNVGCACHR